MLAVIETLFTYYHAPYIYIIHGESTTRKPTIKIPPQTPQNFKGCVYEPPASLSAPGENGRKEQALRRATVIIRPTLAQTSMVISWSAI